MLFKDRNIFVNATSPNYLREGRRNIEEKLSKLIEKAKRKGAISKKYFDKVVQEFISDVKVVINKLERGMDILKLEEVIKLHKIEEYLIFLQGINYLDLVPLLRTLKKRAEVWVDQDRHNLKRIWIEANFIRKHISSQKRDLENIAVINDVVNGIPIALYCKDFNRIPQKAVAILHGFIGDRGGLDLLSKRIAHQGYLVCSFELPGHYMAGSTKPEDEFRLGLTCEYVYNVVRFLRTSYSIKGVAVIGHSAGGVAAIFSLGYYNRTIENAIYTIFQRYLLILEQFKNRNQEHLKVELESLYAQIKSLIFNALSQTRFEGGKIDVVIAISPPRRFQVDFPPPMKRVVLMIKGLVKTKYKHSKTGEFAYGLGSFRSYELNEFLDYILNIKNPLDYMTLISFFATQAKDDRVNLLKYYRKKYIFDVPKLLLYGRYLDLLNRVILPSHVKEYEGAYSVWNIKIRSFPFKGHWLCKGFEALKGKAATSSKVVLEIINFLEENL